MMRMVVVPFVFGRFSSKKELMPCSVIAVGCLVLGLGFFILATKLRWDPLVSKLEFWTFFIFAVMYIFIWKYDYYYWFHMKTKLYTNIFKAFIFELRAWNKSRRIRDFCQTYSAQSHDTPMFRLINNYSPLDRSFVSRIYWFLWRVCHLILAACQVGVVDWPSFTLNFIFGSLLAIKVER